MNNHPRQLQTHQTDCWPTHMETTTLKCRKDLSSRQQVVLVFILLYGFFYVSRVVLSFVLITNTSLAFIIFHSNYYDVSWFILRSDEHHVSKFHYPAFSSSGHLLRMMTLKDFQREAGRTHVPHDFIWEVLCFSLSDIRTWPVSLGLPGISFWLIL